MAKEYFSHDYNTRLDKKIKPLLIKHGYEGYGVFWAIVEDLYNNKNSLPLDYESIAFDYRVSVDLVKSVINDFDLFTIKDKIFFSGSIKTRLKEREKKSEKARKSAQERWAKDANALRTHSERIQRGMLLKESKVKDIKVKESKGVFTPPSLVEVESYFLENGYSAAAAKKAFDYYASANWVDSKSNKVKNWKQKMISVWFKDENKITTHDIKSKDDYIREQLAKQQIGLSHGK